MEALNQYGRPFHQRADEMLVPALAPSETALMLGLSAPDALDAYLVTGGLPLIADEWPTGMPMWEYLSSALSSSTSAPEACSQLPWLAHYRRCVTSEWSALSSRCQPHAARCRATASRIHTCGSGSPSLDRRCQRLNAGPTNACWRGYERVGRPGVAALSNPCCVPESPAWVHPGRQGRRALLGPTGRERMNRRSTSSSVMPSLLSTYSASGRSGGTRPNHSAVQT